MPRTKKEVTTTDITVEPKKRGRKSKAAASISKSEDVLSLYDAMTPEAKEEMERIPPVEGESDVEGGWNTAGIDSDKSYPTIRRNLYIEIELLSDSLGLRPPTAELLDKYIASKAPNALSKEEEIALYGTDEVSKQKTSIWPVARFVYDKDSDHMIDVFMDRSANPDPSTLVECPFLYDYQMRGLFKDACGLLSRAKNNQSAAIKAYRKIIDGNIFVFPRHIAFIVPDRFVNDLGYEQDSRRKDGGLHIDQRPLHTSGPQGDCTAISSSEFVPAGSRCKLRIGLTSDMWLPAVKEWLNYGQVRGIGQWRNSGAGRFRWRELGEDWKPLK